jgi:glycosyltransferase involved in cell wall biosynthesis
VDVTVVVPTFGDQSWVELAKQRAIPSAVALDVPVIAVHDDTLHDARNTGMRMVDTEWMCWLDADDELEPGYFDHIATGTADVRAPSVRYVEHDPWATPRMPRVSNHTHECDSTCLAEGNWLVIGAVVRTVLVRSLGGFHDFPVYEDWDLWVRCWHAGATIEAIPQAVYRAHVRRDSRNRAPNRQERLEAHRAIAAANRLPIPA